MEKRIRSIAREMALQCLFQIDFNDCEIESALASVFEEHEEDARATKAEPYTTLLVNGVLENREEIDDRLDEVSIDWTVERMPATDRNILRIAVYEMYFADELIDKRIAINEAVEIAKEYGTDESPAFVNGVLGKLARA